MGARCALGLLDAAGLGDGVAVSEPEGESGLKGSKDGSLESRRCVVDDHVIGGMTMTCFDQLVGANQIHAIG